MQWKVELQENIRTVQALLPHLPLTAQEQQRLTEILHRFPMSITPYYLSLIDWENEHDPIRKMCIPSIEETDLSGSFDTSGEARNTVVEGLQHKYAQTALLLSTNQCAMYCRHCFRKRLVGSSDEEVAKNFSAMREYILAHTEISNVLISGGDALMNSNRKLEELLSMLVDIPHLDAIRLASRMPVVLPSRITSDEELQRILQKYNRQKQLYLVTQFNHPTEFTAQALDAVRCVRELGIPVKNQTVLLQGINDDPAVLGALLRGLVAKGIDTYYIFQCRPVTGVKNQFQVPLSRGVDIVEAAKAMQNGLGKNLHYCMSHVTGKLEIVGKLPNGELLFKYHEAQNPANLGKLFSLLLAKKQAWLEQDSLLPLV